MVKRWFRAFVVAAAMVIASSCSEPEPATPDAGAVVEAPGSGCADEVSVCDSGFSAEGSSACAQRFVEEGVDAVLGGIDAFGTGVELLAANGVPFVGSPACCEPCGRSPTTPARPS